GATFLDHLIALFHRYCEPVIAVLGHEAQRIRESLHSPALIAFNRNYLSGQLSSMQCGLRHVPAAAPGVLFTLVDHPDPSPHTIERLLQTQQTIAIPVHNDRRGHPVYFRRNLIPQFLSLPAGQTARQIFHAHAAETEFIAVDDPGTVDDIDDPQALADFHARRMAPR
ncbi:MAG: nucleotidyltransferase family protein, partial [Acidobacteriota bacterium]|nr:nucleotidyltransferase family protein [Acidobacteriota bacterium]